MTGKKYNEILAVSFLGGSYCLLYSLQYFSDGDTFAKRQSDKYGMEQSVLRDFLVSLTPASMAVICDVCPNFPLPPLPADGTAWSLGVGWDYITSSGQWFASKNDMLLLSQSM